MSGSDYGAVQSAFAECVRRIFDGGRELTSTILVSEHREYISTRYSPTELIREREENARREEAERERLKAIDRWNESLDWAREHGAQIRRGKITKDLAYYRIYAAGLMEEYSSHFPEFSFDLGRVKTGVERLKARDEEYRDRHARWEAKQRRERIAKELDEKYPM